MESSTSASKQPHVGHRLFRWAMSAWGPRRSPGDAQTAATSPSTSSPASVDVPGRLRLAIVGDVHGAWRGEREEAALRLLGPDLTLLVGDFGNEDVRLVRQVADLALPKAVILGNHDAWYTMTGRSGGVARRGAVQQTLSAADLLADLVARGGGGGASPVGTSPAGGPAQDGVRQQLAALGSCHVGYGTMRLDEQGYTVMGARPFSKGGKNFSTIRAFMEGLYGVTSMDASAARIVKVAESAPPHHPLVVMGHNGPAGLGSRAFDICGVDWESGGGDHGDPDLQSALAALHRSGRRVALVTFGHMHHTLHAGNNRGRASRLRRMVALDPTTGTVFLNAATVPRVIPAAAAKMPPAPPANVTPKSFGSSGRRARMAAKAAAAAAAAAASSATVVASSVAPPPYGSDPATQHHFMVAELEAGEVVSARDVWVQVTPVTDGTAAAVLAAAATAATAADGASGTDSEPEDGDADGADGDGQAVAATTLLTPRRIGDFVVQVVRDHVVLRTVAGANGGVVKFVWNTHDGLYEPYILERDGRGSGGGAAVPGPEGQAVVIDSLGGDGGDGAGEVAAEKEAVAVAAAAGERVAVSGLANKLGVLVARWPDVNVRS